MANNFYVRQGASGSNSGSNWTNAWSDVTQINWNSVKPGDSIWIAGGTYGQLTIGKSGTTNNAIYIARVRSTNAVPASAPGWNSSYDSTVIINLVNGSGGYSWWTLDGQVPYGGIIVTNPTVTTGNGIELGNTGPENYISLLNLDDAGSVQDGVGGSQDIRALNFNLQTPSHGLYVAWCAFHNYDTLWSTLGMSDWTVEHNKFYHNYNGGTGLHPNIIQVMGATNWVFRYNEIYGWQDEGIMMDFVGSSDPPCVNVWIYGNLWHDCLTGRSARVAEAQYNPMGPVYFFNNTVVNVDLTFLAGNGAGSWLPGCVSSNNIFFNVGAAPLGFNGNQDYNLASGANTEAHGIGNASASIFVNYAAQNYHIVTNVGSLFPRNMGVALGAPYNIDFDGNVRGADGAWDIGAYEAGGSSRIVDLTPPTVILTVPANGAIVSNLVTLTATASDNTNGSGVASVTFLVDGVAVGSDSASPYSMTWNSLTVTNGTHTIQALAQDVAGNQAVSSSVIVTVFNPPDTTPPTVSLTAPAAGAVISNSVTLSTTASDNSGGSGVALVTFLVDGAAVGSDSASPYSMTWNSLTVTNGTHGIQARAQDAAGNQATSSSVTVTVQNAALTPASGLVGYWKFDNASGTTATDNSGNGNNGALVGDATWGIGYLNGGLSLDGQSGYVRVPSTPNLEQVSNAVTICAWINFGTNITYTAGDMQDVVRKVISESTNLPPYSAYDLVIQSFGNRILEVRMGVTRASDLTRGTSGWSKAHTYGYWYHLAGVYDGSTVQIYVNGVLESSTSFSGTLLQTSQPLCIGRYGTVGEAMNGIVDDLHLYNRALSATEIETLFNANRPSAPFPPAVQN